MREKKFDEVRKTKLRRIPSSRPIPARANDMAADIRKDVAVLPQRAEFVVGKRAVIVRRALSRGEDVDHFGRPQRNDWAQHDTFDEGEDGGVDADGDREGKNGNCCETRRFDQLPERELEIL